MLRAEDITLQNLPDSEAELVAQGRAGRCEQHAALDLRRVTIALRSDGRCDGCDAESTRCRGCKCYDPAQTSAVRSCLKCTKANESSSPPIFPEPEAGITRRLCERCRGQTKAWEKRSAERRTEKRRALREAGIARYVASMPDRQRTAKDRQYEHHYRKYHLGVVQKRPGMTVMRRDRHLLEAGRRVRWTFGDKGLSYDYHLWRRRHHA